MEEAFSVYVISNGNTDFFKNSLTSFSNKLPFIKELDSGEWYCGVSGFGIHLQIDNLRLPRNTVASFFLPNGLDNLNNRETMEKIISTPAFMLNFGEIEQNPVTVLMALKQFFKGIELETLRNNYPDVERNHLSAFHEKSASSISHIRFEIINRANKSHFFLFHPYYL